MIEQTHGVIGDLDWNAISGLDLEKLLGTGMKKGEIPFPKPRPAGPVKKKSMFLAPPTGGTDGKNLHSILSERRIHAAFGSPMSNIG
jgi:hypothetical protein